MDLTFIGTGAAFAPAFGNTAAYFTRGEDLYLIDCGEQVFARLMRASLLTRYPGEITVCVTHLHADHCGSLATLCLYAASVLGRKVTIVHPDADIEALLALMGARPGQYARVASLSHGALTITPHPAVHAPNMPAWAYTLRDEAETIYYSGDQNNLPPEVLAGLRGGTIAHAYLDVNWFDAPPEHPVHLPFGTLCRQVEAPLRGRCTLMHVNRDFSAQAKAEGFAWAEMAPDFA